MDFKRVYDNSYHKARKLLTEDQKAYMHGYAMACHEISVFLNNPDVFETVPENLPALAKIEEEIREKTIKELMQWMSWGWYEAIVGLIDDAEGEEGTDNTGKLSSDIWNLPEPVPEEPSDDPAEIFISKPNEEIEGEEAE